MLDLLIRNGVVVNSSGVMEADIGVRDGRIASLSAWGSVESPAKRVLEASGMFVLPGGIDPHVHFEFPAPDGVLTQSAFHGSMAAAYGGTTTFVDFALQNGDEALMGAVEEKLARTLSQAVNVDYAMHAIISGSFGLSLCNEIPRAVAAGVNSFKLFTTFRSGATPVGLYCDDGRIFSVMEAVRECGGVVMVHCEDEWLIDYHVRRLYSEGRAGFVNLCEARPPLAEESAVRRMLLLSERTGCPLYVVHMSAKESVQALEDALARGVPAYGEVLHQNLLFDADVYEEANGQRYVNYPPNKGREHRDALWRACLGGALAAVASDDYTISLANKTKGTMVDDCRGGTNSIETRMGILWSEGVVRRGMDMCRFADLTSAMPARIFGLYGRKGVIGIGADADLVVIDPRQKTVYEQGVNLHSDCDYSNWDGWTLNCAIAATILRGTILVESGQWVGPVGMGRFVPASM